MHLAVYPPDGRVRVAVPLRIDDEAVRLAVISRLPWIHRHQRKYAGQERQSSREYVSRESHYFKGRRYLLNVIEYDGRAKVVVSGKPTIDLYVSKGAGRTKRDRILQQWYRKELKAQIPPLIAKWEPVMGVKVYGWGVKRMRTKWGSCNIRARRIWLNLELVKKPTECLEYVLVHELVHLLERQHNERFKAHMDQILPHWRLLRDRLNGSPLSHEEWKY